MDLSNALIKYWLTQGSDYLIGSHQLSIPLSWGLNWGLVDQKVTGLDRLHIDALAGVESVEVHFLLHLDLHLQLLLLDLPLLNHVLNFLQEAQSRLSELNLIFLLLLGKLLKNELSVRDQEVLRWPLDDGGREHIRKPVELNGLTWLNHRMFLTSSLDCGIKQVIYFLFFSEIAWFFNLKLFNSRRILLHLRCFLSLGNLGDLGDEPLLASLRAGVASQLWHSDILWCPLLCKDFFSLFLLPLFARFILLAITNIFLADSVLGELVLQALVQLLEFPSAHAVDTNQP